MPTLKGIKASLSCVQCFLYLVSSSENVSIFHSTWLDTFWTDWYIYVYMCVCIFSGNLFAFSNYFSFVKKHNVIIQDTQRGSCGFFSDPFGLRQILQPGSITSFSVLKARVAIINKKTSTVITTTFIECLLQIAFLRFSRQDKHSARQALFQSFL